MNGRVICKSACIEELIPVILLLCGVFYKHVLQRLIESLIEAICLQKVHTVRTRPFAYKKCILYVPVGGKLWSGDA